MPYKVSCWYCRYVVGSGRMLRWLRCMAFVICKTYSHNFGEFFVDNTKNPVDSSFHSWDDTQQESCGSSNSFKRNAMNTSRLDSVGSLKGMNADMAMRARMLQQQMRTNRSLGDVRTNLRQLEQEQMYLQIALDFAEDIYGKLRHGRLV